MSALRLVSLIEQIAHEERPTQIDSSPCAHCPSVAMPNDPEMIDLRDPERAPSSWRASFAAPGDATKRAAGTATSSASAPRIWKCSHDEIWP